ARPLARSYDDAWAAGPVGADACPCATGARIAEALRAAACGVDEKTTALLAALEPVRCAPEQRAEGAGELPRVPLSARAADGMHLEDVMAEAAVGDLHLDRN